MASTRWFSAMTSITRVVAPRAWARVASARTSPEPTPRPCQASRHHHADLGRRVTTGTGGVHRHRMPDDRPVLGRHQNIGVGPPARQHPQHRRAGRQRATEEPQVTGLHREAAEKVPERLVIGAAGLPDPDLPGRPGGPGSAR
jgi:hypothetical protein